MSEGEVARPIRAVYAVGARHTHHRAQKDWATADHLRDQLRSSGCEIYDKDKVPIRRSPTQFRCIVHVFSLYSPTSSTALLRGWRAVLHSTAPHHTAW